MSSATSVSLEESKPCHLGKGLKRPLLRAVKGQDSVVKGLTFTTLSKFLRPKQDAFSPFHTKFSSLLTSKFYLLELYFAISKFSQFVQI